MQELDRCAVCRRTPLVGEEMLVLRGEARDSFVCALCIECPRASALGEMVRRERVRTTAGAKNVARVLPDRAAVPVGASAVTALGLGR